MSKINSKQKGKRGELEVVNVLKEYGYDDAQRTQQYCGTGGTSDVRCRSLPQRTHIEVKREERLNVEKALQQAEADAHELDLPIVFHRKNGDDWKVTLRAENYLALMNILTNS